MSTSTHDQRKILTRAIMRIHDVAQARIANPIGDSDRRYERYFDAVRSIRDIAAKALDDANAAGEADAATLGQELGVPPVDITGFAETVALVNAHAREPLRGDDKLIPATANLQHAVMRMRDSLPLGGREHFDATPQEFTVQVNLADLLTVLESFEAQPAAPAADEAVGAYTIDAEPLPNHRQIFNDGSGGTLSFDRGTTNIEVINRLSKFGKLMDVVLDLLSVRTTGGHYRDFAEAAQVYENRVRRAGEQIAAVLPEPKDKPLAEGGPVFSPGGRKITVHTGRGSMRAARALRDIKGELAAHSRSEALSSSNERLARDLALLDRVHHLSDRSTYGLEEKRIAVEHLAEPPAPAKRYRRVRPAGFEEERGTRVVNLGNGLVYSVRKRLDGGARYLLERQGGLIQNELPALCLDVVEEVSDAPGSPRIERGSGIAFC